MKKRGGIIFCVFLFGSIALQAYAHSGRTNASGCHNDNIHGGYHCHNAPAAVYTPEPVYEPVYAALAAPTFYEEINGTPYYSQSEYDAALASIEEEAKQAYRKDVRKTYKNLMEVAPSDADIDYWVNYSADVKEVRKGIKDSGQYKQLQQEKEAKAAELSKQDEEVKPVEPQIVDDSADEKVVTQDEPEKEDRTNTKEEDSGSGGSFWFLAFLIAAGAWIRQKMKMRKQKK